MHYVNSHFSEVSPSPHDTGRVTLCTQWQSAFELHAHALLGLPVDTSLRNSGASHVIYGVVDALSIPGTNLRLLGKPESLVRRSIGVALARADSIEPARERARHMAARVRDRRIASTFPRAAVVRMRPQTRTDARSKIQRPEPTGAR